MRYLVSNRGLRLGGVDYPPGGVVDIIGATQAQFYAEYLVPITDAALIRALETNADPVYVMEPFRWARVDHGVGDIVWVPNRAAMKQMPAGTVRPATGDEILAWVARTAKGRVPDAAPDTPAKASAKPKARGTSTRAAKAKRHAAA